MELKNFLNEADINKSDYEVSLSINEHSGAVFRISMRDLRFPTTVYNKVLVGDKESMSKRIEISAKIFQEKDKELTQEVTDIMDTAITLIKAKLKKAILEADNEFDKQVAKL